MDTIRVAIVTTLRDAGPTLDSFITYHLAIGFSELFLFFDDPADPDLARVAAIPGVTAIAHDAALREAWRGLPTYAEQGAFVDSEVMARQILNADYAIGLARARGMDWLLHIDADELFYAPRESVQDHFEAHANTSYESVRYLNYEAIPEPAVGEDVFRDVTLFRRPHTQMGPEAPDALEAALQISQLRPGFFHFYRNGKSAGRLSVPGLRPHGVHQFTCADGIAQTLSSRQFVLHYACCGFEAFWRKYVTLGAFGDKWWGKTAIAPAVSFHLESRDVVAKGREAALAFYRERLELADRARADELVRHGLLDRIELPREILSRTSER